MCLERKESQSLESLVCVRFVDSEGKETQWKYNWNWKTVWNYVVFCLP
jgi:hypothetical protein